MIAIYGLALICASVLLLVFVAKIRNAAKAPRWAASKILLQAVLFCTMTGFIFGVSLLFDAIATFRTTGLTATEWAIAAAIIVATAVIWRQLMKIGKGDTATANLPPTANVNEPGAAAGGKSGKSPRKAA